jgi:hypothetical protein
METLGLSGPPTRDGSFFKRLFWPSADSADADILGQQGFWICSIVALADLIPEIFRGHLVAGIFFAAIYFLGGIGVREHDVLSAVAVALVNLVNLTTVCLMMRRPPGLLDLFIGTLLMANIRGCWIASKWAMAGDPCLIPMRMNETWRDKFVDQMPARVWPRVRVIFYIIAALGLILTVWGLVTAMLKGPSAVVDI